MMKMNYNEISGTDSSRINHYIRTKNAAFAAIMLWIFALLAMPVTAQAQTPVTVEVSNLRELRMEITNYGIRTGDDTVITVTGDFSITDVLTIPANNNGRTLTIRSANPQSRVTLWRGFSGATSTEGLFVVSSGAKLILEDIVINGDKDTYSSSQGSLVSVSGEFTMNAGAVLTNNMSYSYSNSDASSYGGGVYVSGGTFTMFSIS